MTLVVCWILFPLVLCALSLGCGLALERMAGIELPGTLLFGAGLALLIVVADYATQLDATAELAVPIVLVLGIAGLITGRHRLRRGTIDRWPLAAAFLTFALYAAPTVFSGQATFAGYLKIEDTAIWAAITDHVMEHGRSLSALHPSSYQSVLDLYLGSGYPVGSFLPLGVGRALVGQDVAWTIQPYLAFLAAMLALVLYELAKSVIASRPLRAIVALLATQSALLFAFGQWGAMKELAAVVLFALVATLAEPVLRSDGPIRRLLPLAVAAAAALAALSVGGGVWIGPVLAPALVIALLARGRRPVTREAVGFLAIGALLALPTVIRASSFLSVAGNVLTLQTELGNLHRPLDTLQIFGIWPTGDFRTDTSSQSLTDVLIAVVALAGVVGVVHAFVRRAWEAVLFIGAAAVGCLVIASAGSPWTDAKAFAVASPAVLFAAGLGAAGAYERGRRFVAVPVFVLIAAGVLWSNALAYHEVDLAPRSRLAELQKIGKRIDGEGPTLVTEYEFWGPWHFLRGADPLGANLPFRPTSAPFGDLTAAGGQAIQEGVTLDIDAFDQGALAPYRTLVLRRSPFESRPPSSFELVWRGRYYDAWQRRSGSPARLVTHIPLGANTGAEPAEQTVSCPQVAKIARGASAGDRLAVVQRPSPDVLDLSHSTHPSSWPTEAPFLHPDSSGTVRLTWTAKHAGTFAFWLGGSFRGGLTLKIDGKKVRSERGELNYASGAYVPLGRAAVAAGPHAISLDYDVEDLHPGSGGDAILPFGDLTGLPSPIGPLAVSPVTADGIEVVRPGDVRRLCGRSLDWIEVVGP